MLRLPSPLFFSFPLLFLSFPTPLHSPSLSLSQSSLRHAPPPASHPSSLSSRRLSPCRRLHSFSQLAELANAHQPARRHPYRAAPLPLRLRMAPPVEIHEDSSFTLFFSHIWLDHEDPIIVSIPPLQERISSMISPSPSFSLIFLRLLRLHHGFTRRIGGVPPRASSSTADALNDPPASPLCRCLLPSLSGFPRRRRFLFISGISLVASPANSRQSHRRILSRAPVILQSQNQIISPQNADANVSI